MGLTSAQVSGTCSFDWPQQIGDGVFDPTAAQTEIKREREPPLRCPRCDSSNTKFCYYNNYSRSQPRHFCRACKRHWTHGGTLRSVPVGGCPRKNKRQRLTVTPPESSIATLQPEADFFTGNGVLNSSVFPDIFRRVLFYPTPEHAGANTSSGFQSEYQTLAPAAAASKDEGAVVNPSPIAASSSYSNGSTLDSVAGDTTLLSLMPGSGSSGDWIQDPSPLPESYFWWNDTLADFIAPLPPAAQPPLYPWTDE